MTCFFPPTPCDLTLFMRRVNRHRAPKLMQWVAWRCGFPANGPRHTCSPLVASHWQTPKLAPYGLAAQQCLMKLGLWEDGQHAKFPGVIARAVYGNNISQTFGFVSTGNVDAGFVALSQLLAKAISREHYWLVPPSCHDPIEQKALLLNLASQAAADLLSFLMSPDAQAKLSSLGYARAQ